MTTDITELAQSLKAAAEKATPGPWGVARDGKTLVSNQSHPIATVSDAMHRMLADGSTGKDAEFIALANPANILALVEALEKAQGMEAYWKVQCRGITDHCEVLQARIAELESRTVKLPDDEDGQAYGFGKWSNSKLPATAGTMTIAYCEDAWRAAFKVFSSAAGIKVEAE